MMDPAAPGRSGPAIVLRLAVLIAFIVAASWGAHIIREALDLTLMPGNEQQVHRAIMLGSVAHIGLLAMPFVPGAEIGIAMLTAFGAAIAPLVYAATVVSMMLAYAVGRLVPISVLLSLLRLLRLNRASALVERAAPLSGEARLTMLLEGASAKSVGFALRHRYIALALSVNTPGNSIIGGGGGIMLMAGLSGIFAPWTTLLTIALAVSPVPLAILFLGA